jgi:hypothetical protein
VNPQRGVMLDGIAVKLLVIVFGCWAALVAWGVEQITGQIKEIHEESTLTAEKFRDHEQSVLQRIATLESYQHMQDADRLAMKEEVDGIHRELARMHHP